MDLTFVLERTLSDRFEFIQLGMGVMREPPYAGSLLLQIKDCQVEIGVTPMEFVDVTEDKR